MRRLAKRCQIDHQDCLAGIGHTDKIGIEVNHVAPHRCAAERSCQKPHHQCEAIALVATDWQQETFVSPLWIEQGAALSVDHPALGHHLAALGLCFDLAIGSNGGCHVQHDGRFDTGGDCSGDRIGRQQHIHPAPGRQVIGVANREVKPNHVFVERTPRIQGSWPSMVAVAGTDPGHARLTRLSNRKIDGPRNDQMPHAVITIDHRHRRSFFHHPNLRIPIDATCLNPLRIRWQSDHAMAIRSLQIRLGHEAPDQTSVFGRKTQPFEG